jgi:hypothetical protein
MKRPKIFNMLVPKQLRPHKGAGRPGKTVISSLVIKYVHKDTGKDYYGCVGVGCYWFRAGNAQECRILKHAPSCRHLSDDLKLFANEHAAGSSLGAKLEALQSAEPTVSTSQPLKKAKSLTEGAIVLNFAHAGRQELQTKLDHCIMKLICVAGLVPHILDSPEWKEFVSIANPKYRVTPSDQFEEKIIPSEAAYVRKQVLQILQKQENLTLTFDGNSTRKAQSLYTVHVTTKDRQSYFVDAYEGSDERHTAKWIKEKILMVSPSWHSHILYFMNCDVPRLCRKLARQTLLACVPTVQGILGGDGKMLTKRLQP